MNAILQSDNSYNGFSFTFDWFTGILDCDNVAEFLLGLVDIDDRFSLDNFFAHKFGLYNYSFRIMLAGMPSISFAWNPDYNSTRSLYNFSTVPKIDKSTGEVLVDGRIVSCDVKSIQNPGLFISISGDGLRFLGDDTVQKLFKYFYDFGVRSTRLDIACDIKDRDNFIIPMLQEAFSHACSYEPGDLVLHAPHHQHTKFSTTLISRTQYDSLRHQFVTNWQLGDHGSNFGMFRMYDKYFEVAFGRHSDRAKEMLIGIDYWERLECELHQYAAQQLFNEIMSSDLSIKVAFASAFGSLIRVAQGKSSGYHRSQLPTDQQFEEFLTWLGENVHFVQFVSDPFVESTPEKFINHSLHMASYLSTVFELVQNVPGLYDMIEELASKRKRTHPGKYSWVQSYIDKLSDELRALS